MGWQRRSSGARIIVDQGTVFWYEKSGKVLEYGSRVSNCKQCEMNSSTNIQKAHGCRMNRGGSAKAMEADLAVELLNRSKMKTIAFHN